MIAVAVVMAAHFPDLAGLEKALEELPGALRLGLDREKTPAVVQGCVAEVSALKDALGS